MGVTRMNWGVAVVVGVADWGRDQVSLTSCLPFIRHTLMSLGLERQVSFWGHREPMRGARYTTALGTPSGQARIYLVRAPSAAPSPLVCSPSSPAGTAAPWR